MNKIETELLDTKIVRRKKPYVTENDKNLIGQLTDRKLFKYPMLTTTGLSDKKGEFKHFIIHTVEKPKWKSETEIILGREVYVRNLLTNHENGIIVLAKTPYNATQYILVVIDEDRFTKPVTFLTFKRKYKNLDYKR